MTLEDRLTLIAEAASIFSPWTGNFTREDLIAWREREFGNRSFIVPKNLLHIISGNTPHAAFQSLLAGLVLGAKNRIKLPSIGLPEFENHLPKTLLSYIEISRTLSPEWITEADGITVYGSDATIAHFRSIAALEIPFVGHGHRLGVALINEANEEAAKRAAKDIADFDQHGCLSLQTIYLDDPQAFAPLLANALEALPPRKKLSLSEAGAISNLTQEITYLAAQEPENYALWAHEDYLIIYDGTPALSLSPGNRVVFLKPHSTFKSHRQLSGIGLHPYEERDDLPSPRIFPLGQAQHPPFAWHHDGLPPLASLVRFQERHQNILNPLRTTPT